MLHLSISDVQHSLLPGVRVDVPLSVIVIQKLQETAKAAQLCGQDVCTLYTGSTWGQILLKLRICEYRWIHQQISLRAYVFRSFVG